MKKELKDSKNVQLLVDLFYEKVKQDDLLSPIFSATIKDAWEAHMPVLYSFWESVLLDTGSYKGNPMTKHIQLNKEMKLTKEHFDRWVLLWVTTLNDNFKGGNSTLAKEIAESMKELMLYKIKQSEDPNFIQ